MAKYRYVGPGPIEVLSGGEITRPGDEREFDEEPTWGLWGLVPDEPDTDEGDPEPPGPQEASPAAPGAAPAPGLTAPSLAAPVKEF
jgi:hypothetical protein